MRYVGMDYPSSNPAAFLFREEADPQSQLQPQSQSLWDPAFGPFSLESFFAPDPSFNQSLDAAADHSAGLTIGPRSCASQVVRPTDTSVGNNLVPNSFHFGDARATWHPAVVENGVPVSPSALSNIVRQHAANSNRPRPYPAQPPKACVPTHHRPVGTYLAGLAHPASLSEFTNWGNGLLNLTPHAAYPPPQPPNNPFQLGALPSPGLPGRTSFNPNHLFPSTAPWMRTQTSSGSIPSSVEGSRFLPSAHPDNSFDHFDALSDDGCLGSPSIECDASLLSEAQYTPGLSPSPSVNLEGLSCDHGHPSARLSTNMAVAGAFVPDFASPGPQRPKGVAKRPEPCFAIVQYKPSEDIEERTSKKRPALEEISPQGMVSQTLRHVSMQDENGEVQGTMMTFGKRIKTRANFSQEKRQQTALARREGVCGRCKNQKRQCDLSQKESLYESCTLCTSVRLYKKVARMPCFKVTLEDILFFRSGPASNGPFSTQRRIIYELGDLSKPHVSVRTLKLTHHVGSHHLIVYAAEFTPSPGDRLSYKWQDASGEPHEQIMPNFCLTNLTTIHNHFLQYIESAKWSYLKTFQTKDELARMTVSMAIEYAKRRPDSLVADALTLWAISRMIEVPWEMCGTDTLGVSRIDDPSNPRHGKIPIPPNMDTQLDQIVIQWILKPLRERVVKKFEDLITPAKPEAWFEVYLSAFILLNHIERLAQHSTFQAKLHTMRTKYSNIPFLEGVFHTAKSILARFHFVCNGSAPLKLDWKSPKTMALAKLERNEVEFMKKSQAMIAAREHDVLGLRKTHKYEQSLYWAGQLFFGNFDTSPVHVVEELDESPVKMEA